MKLIVVSLGLTVLLILAVLGNSAVMFVSGLGIGVALWSTREAPLRTQLGALVAGALVAGIGAEVVHTFYHLVGLINAVAMAVVVLLAHTLGRQRAR